MKVFLVGAGPGSPDLLTVRAARLLAEADVVFYDALVSQEVLALAKTARKIAVGKRCGRHSTAQRFINRRLADAARRYGRVVRLKGGDPMLFGRAQEEIDFLRAQGIGVEVVAGVTAASAAGAALGVSLTRRGIARSVVLATPRAGEGESRSAWARAAASGDTVALYMGAHDAQAVVAELLAAGVRQDMPLALVESISLPGEQAHYGTLSELPQLARRLSGGPALIVLGDVLQEAVAGRVEPAGIPRSASQAA
ncbi:MAG: uroporphyrinogen-III C-methyltransferase [Betaproteobacteria bacterium]